MSEKLPRVDYDDLIRALRRAGFVLCGNAEATYISNAIPTIGV